MNTLTDRLKRNAYGVAAVMLTAAVTLPTLLVGQASAATLVERSITMSSSAQSAEATYRLNYTPSDDHQSIIIDFCDTASSPLIGHGCDAPAGMNVEGASVAGGDWEVDGDETEDAHLGLVNTDDPVSNAQEIVIEGIINPSVIGTFYARITTYADNEFGDYVSETNVGNPVDEGSVPLSIVHQVDISAAVLETLTFCVRALEPTEACGGTDTAPSLELGQGSPPALAVDQVDTGDAWFQLSSNAFHGVSVSMAGDTLRSGSNIIDPVGDVAAPISAGTEAFGMRFETVESLDELDPLGELEAEDLYAGPTNYGFDLSDIGSAYGGVIATSDGPLADWNAQMRFAATISPVTAPGLYTTTLTLIATGTY